jgi:hypothetical protein
MTKRRGQGEGSVYLRTDGRWCATISLMRPTGARARKSFYGKTRKEVADQLTKALRERQTGPPSHQRSTDG